MNYRLRLLLPPAILLAVLAAAPIQAQAPSSQPNQAPTTPQTLGPQPCADATTEGRGTSRHSDSSSSKQDLSQKLDEGNGVLCPPAAVDPGIEVPPPNVGRTPVIPAPGTPGGDPTVQPK
jgi:hypothetical protein